MPYWRLSGFYFFYFATLGVLVPYWGLYLQSIGFTPVDIGSLVAILMFSRIVAPLVWGWIADHREGRMAVVRLASFLTVVAFAGAFLGTAFWWLAAVMPSAPTTSFRTGSVIATPSSFSVSGNNSTTPVLIPSNSMGLKNSLASTASSSRPSSGSKRRVPSA